MIARPDPRPLDSILFVQRGSGHLAALGVTGQCRAGEQWEVVKFLVEILLSDSCLNLSSCGV